MVAVLQTSCVPLAYVEIVLDVKKELIAEASSWAKSKLNDSGFVVERSAQDVDGEGVDISVFGHKNDHHLRASIHVFNDREILEIALSQEFVPRFDSQARAIVSEVLETVIQRFGQEPIRKIRKKGY